MSDEAAQSAKGVSRKADTIGIAIAMLVVGLVIAWLIYRARKGTPGKEPVEYTSIPDTAPGTTMLAIGTSGQSINKLRQVLNVIEGAATGKTGNLPIDTRFDRNTENLLLKHYGAYQISKADAEALYTKFQDLLSTTPKNETN